MRKPRQDGARYNDRTGVRTQDLRIKSYARARALEGRRDGFSSEEVTVVSGVQHTEYR